MNQGAQRAFISYIFSLILTQSATGATQRFVTTARSACRAVAAARQSVITRQTPQLRTVTMNASRSLSVLHNHGQAHPDYRGLHYTAVAAGLALAGWSQHQTAYAEEKYYDVRLLYAAKRGDVDEIKRLLAQGAHIDSQDRWGDTALDQAIYYGRYDVAAFLISAGASPDVGNVWGLLRWNLRGAARFATSCKKIFAAPEAVRQQALQAVQSDAPVTLMQQLLEQGLDPNATVKDEPLLNRAVQAGNREVVSFLVQMGAKLNPCYATAPLIVATRQANVAMMQWLIEQGAPVTDDVCVVACELNTTAVLSFLLRQGKFTGYHRCAAAASAAGALETLGLLLGQYTVSTLRQSREKRPLLFYAIENQQHAAAELLLNAGANPGELWKKETPLSLAAKHGNAALVRLLHQKGASLDARINRRTTLHEACQMGNVSMARVLLELGANVEQTDKQGRTALHTAVAACKPDVVQLLLERGACMQAKDGKSNLPVALCLGCSEQNRVKIRTLFARALTRTVPPAIAVPEIPKPAAAKSANIDPAPVQKSSAASAPAQAVTPEIAPQLPESSVQVAELHVNQNAPEEIETTSDQCQECSAIMQVTQWLGLGDGQCCNTQE